MAKRPGTTKELATRLLLEKTFTANGSTDPVEVFGMANVFVRGLRGTTGAVVTIEYSYNGTDWDPVPATATGAAVAWDADTAAPGCTLAEDEPGVQYRATVSGTWTGTISVRFSA